MFLRFNAVEDYAFEHALLCFAVVLMAYSIALSVFNIREKNSEVSYVYSSARAFSVLSASVSAGQGKKHAVYVHAGNRLVVYNSKLCFLSYRSAAV